MPGKPYTLYTHPEVAGGVQCGYPVNHAELLILENQLVEREEPLPVFQVLYDLCDAQNLPQPTSVVSIRSAVELYISLKTLLGV